LAARLVGAALLALVLLLFAPVAALAPAFGESGRLVFGAWCRRLLGAVLAKLLYSVLFGMALMMMNLLAGVDALGWWVQWALISAFWWVVLLRRNELLALPAAARTRGAAGPGPRARPGTLRRAVRRQVDGAADRALDRGRGWVRNRLAPPPLSGEQLWRRRMESERQAGAMGREQAARTLEADHQQALDQLASEPGAAASIAAKREQLARIERAQTRLAEQRAHTGAGGGGGGRRGATREARLATRAKRVAAEIAEQQGALTAARDTARLGERAVRNGGRAFTREQLAARAALLDEQARLPDARSVRPGGPRRDYRRLAGLAGHGEREWDMLSAQRRRAATLDIDRALAQRDALTGVARELADAQPLVGARERRRIGRDISAAGAAALHARGERAPGDGQQRSPITRWLDEERRRSGADGPPRTLSARAQEERGARMARERRTRQMSRDWRADG
ncbi:MAG: hypothetical protein ACYDA6_07380, partial [Solirubrobacteraceae bacterium]